MTDSANVENRIRLMPFTSRQLSFVSAAAGYALLASLLCAFLVIRSASTSFIQEPLTGERNPDRPSMEAHRAGEQAALSELDWTVFESSSPTREATEGALAGRFRLAGTFLEYGSDVENRRKAILDDLRTGVQSIVAEGADIDDVTVIRILTDRVVMRTGGREETLWLTFTDGAASKGNDAGDGVAESLSDIDESYNRFGGKRVGERRWVFKREALMGYYRELMDNPERLVKVFDSLHPVYTDNNSISGYHLQIEGEPEFFDAAGFMEGDVVRAVNSVDMTNRRRAEFFIRQFAEGKSSAFVIELERGGNRQKFIYQVR
jgi:type II secretory pathway component PulC